MNASIHLDHGWFPIPEQDGPVPGTTLHATWRRDSADGFTLTRLALLNTGDAPVALGSCHLLELDTLDGLRKGDRVFLDSGGGWPTGCVEVTSTIFSPRYAFEFWKEIFLAREDIEWAADIMEASPEKLQQGAPGAHYSFGGIGAVQSADRGLVFGFTAPLQRSNATPFLLCDPATGALRRLALASNFAGFLLQPGARVETEEAAIAAFPSAQQGLEAWADMSRRRSNIHLRHETSPVGWLSWYGYRLDITADEVNRVADFIRGTYPGFGFQYMQIDLGYNDGNIPGKWFRTNDHFPNGLLQFADDMRSRGFTPGIWCSLTLAADGILAAGRLDNAYQWFWEPHCPVADLDPTHPEAAAFMRKTIRYFKSLGIKYFKIDFLNRLGRVDDAYHPYDPSVIRGAETYRAALKLICDELAPDDFLYACSNLALHSIGLASTTMSACDIGNTGIRHDPARRDFVREQFRSTMSRYFLQNRLIQLTADAICIAPPADLEEARLRTLFVALSGGQVFLGDQFQRAAPEILDLVRRVLPPYGHAARPVDLFGPEGPCILRLDTPERPLYSFFNFEDARTMRVDLPDDREYDVWNFFEERYEGRARGSFSCAVPAVAARHFAFTPVSDAPRVIGTSFHVTCGAVELSNLESPPHSLSGYLTRPAGDFGKIFIMDEHDRLRTIELTATEKPLFWKL
jgi:alpha-galactosidase